MKLIIYQFDLALKYPFGISRHTYKSIESYIVELTDGKISGYGEATTNPYYNITKDNLLESFRKANAFFIEYSFETPEDLWGDLSVELNDNTFALSAIDCAAHDYYGKKTGTTFRRLHGIDSNNQPLTSYTLGIDSLDKVLKKIKDLPWPIYKIKVGMSDDMELIKAIRKQTKSKIRIDANCAWKLEDAIELSKDLKDLQVEFIEQPLSKNDWRGAGILFNKSALPVIADESCQGIEDVEKCAGKFHGINIKLSKCGGLTPAIKMIREARSLNLSIMIGCMTESTVGISAAAQLAPLVDYIDLDGPLLLAEDVATGLKYDHGKLIISDNPGLGIKFFKTKYAGST